MLRDVFRTPLHIICFATIFEAIETTTQDTTLFLTIDRENLFVEIPNELAYCRFLFRLYLFAPEHRSSCRLSATYTVKPIFHLALYLQQQVIVVDLQRAIDNRLSNNIYWFEN